VFDLLKPEYLWRPRQILRRLSFQPSENATLSLPWNCTIHACSAEIIGRAIATQGVYDLPLTEAILRLTDSAETAFDVGANIGYMSLVLALAAGPRGRVCCFEPNPNILPVLHTNVAGWKRLPIASIEVMPVALSDRDGEALLGFSPGYEQNRGMASLEVQGNVPVRLCRLDTLPVGGAGLMKVDVEGHERSVFLGAGSLLEKKRIRDILFEEHRPFPAPSHQILLEHGYRIFRLTRSAWRPLLLPPEAPARQINTPSNFLATADASRARDRFQPWGWKVLTGDWPRSRNS
jgi:FkbM family methyltransferase